MYDAVFYYGYLPSILQYEDATFKFLDNNKKRNKEGNHLKYKLLIKKRPDGVRFLKATYGVALFELPFYAIAHQYAKFRKFKANGISGPYRLSLLIACNFYLIIGLIYLRKLLLKYFSVYASELTIIAIVLGTNFFTYLTYVPGMSHGYNFFSVCIFLYCIDQWQSHKRAKHLFVACFCLGLLILLRPTNASYGLFLLLFNIDSLKSRYALVSRYFKQYFIGFVIVLIPLIPQLIYWKLLTGSWLFYSYGDEPFFWDDPKVLDGLFSFRKGWLIYSPLMVLSLIGLFSKNPIIKKNRIQISVFLLINLYVIFSWWCWWYGGSFGQRPMIDFYPLLAISMAASISFIFNMRRPFKLIGVVAICLLVFLSLFQNYQYQAGIIHHNAMTKSAYKAVFLKVSKPDNFNKKLNFPNYKKALKGKR